MSYANIVQKQRAIVDGDIIKRSSYLNSTDDDDTFNDCICSILLSISYCFLQMRHYKNTVYCLDECLEIDENNVIALFRRSQDSSFNLELIKLAIGKVNQELKKQEILKNQLISHYSKDLLPESTRKRIGRN